MFTIISFFQTLINGIRAGGGGGLENFSKIDKRGLDDDSALESATFL